MNMHHHRPKWSERPPHWPPEGWPAEEWAAEWSRRRRFFIRRFISWLIFGAISMTILLLGLALLFLTATGRGQFGPSELLLVVACAVVPLLVGFFVFGALVFGRLGSPLAEMMAAADAVAEGNLSVRVRERGSGNMVRLMRRFNRMTAELQRAEQGRRNLTADVAHELRTPLQIIQGNLEGVLDGIYEPTPDHIRATLEETRLLGRLVGDLQTLSLAEAGQLPVHTQTMPAIDLLDDVVTRFMPQAVESGVTLKIAPGGEDVELDVDPDRLDQVLSNLVGNALRYTPAGGHITLSVRAAEGGAELSVADSGAGIDPADLPHIFDRFWRGDPSRTRGTGAGSGLGLAIARQLIRLHGGTITVASAPGAGTTFTVSLPVASAGAGQMEPERSR